MSSLISTHQNRLHFLSIVSEIREILGYKLLNNEPEYNDELAMEMTYGDFEFALVHSNNDKSDCLSVECIFGEIPDKRRDKIYEKLLQINYMLSEVDCSSFSIDAQTDQLIYLLKLNLLDQTGNLILKKMTEIVWHGKRWLETYFVTIEEQTQTISNPFKLA